MAEELPIAKAAMVQRRHDRETAEMRSKALPQKLHANEAEIAHEEISIREAHSTRRELEMKAAKAATEHDPRIDQLNCECHALEREIQAVRAALPGNSKDAAQGGSWAARERELVDTLAVQLRSSTEQLRLAEEAQLADLSREDSLWLPCHVICSSNRSLTDTVLTFDKVCLGDGGRRPTPASTQNVASTIGFTTFSKMLTIGFSSVRRRPTLLNGTKCCCS